MGLSPPPDSSGSTEGRDSTVCSGGAIIGFSPSPGSSGSTKAAARAFAMPQEVQLLTGDGVAVGSTTLIGDGVAVEERFAGRRRRWRGVTLSPAASLRRRKLRTSISAPSDQRPTRLPLPTWASVAVTMIIPSMRNCMRGPLTLTRKTPIIIQCNRLTAGDIALCTV